MTKAEFRLHIDLINSNINKLYEATDHKTMAILVQAIIGDLTFIFNSIMMDNIRSDLINKEYKPCKAEKH